jgi:hypothetical protein
MNHIKQIISRINKRMEGLSWVQKMKHNAEERRLKKALASLAIPEKSTDSFDPDRISRYGSGAGV